MLLAGSWFAPAPARAGCAWGDPGHQDPSRPTAHFALLELAGPESPDATLPHPMPPGSPCAAGMCKPAAPLPPVSFPPAPTRADLWGCLTVDVPSFDPGGAAYPFDDGCPRPTCHGLPLDRPPRAEVPPQVA